MLRPFPDAIVRHCRSAPTFSRDVVRRRVDPRNRAATLWIGSSSFPQSRCTVSGSFDLARPLSPASFGGRLSLGGDAGALRFIREAERAPETLPRALADSGGLLLLPGMQAMADDPGLLARLSRLFGT